MRAELAVALAGPSLPTVMTLMALGAMLVDHPLSLGMLGMHGGVAPIWRSTSDLLIAVGACLTTTAPPAKVAAFCPWREDHSHRHRPSEPTRSRRRTSASPAT